MGALFGPVKRPRTGQAPQRSLGTTLRVLACAAGGGLAGLLTAQQACALHAVEPPAAAATAPAPVAVPDALPPARPMHADWVTPLLPAPGTGTGEAGETPPRDPRLGEPQAPEREPRPDYWQLTLAPRPPGAT